MHSRGDEAADEGNPHGFADRSRPAHFDCGYERNGTANLFMVHAPLSDQGMSRSPTAGRGKISPDSSGTSPTFTSPAKRSCQPWTTLTRISQGVFTTLSRRTRPAGSATVSRFTARRNTAAVAEHRRERNQRAEPSVSVPAHSGPGDALPRGFGMAESA